MCICDLLIRASLDDKLIALSSISSPGQSASFKTTSLDAGFVPDAGTESKAWPRLNRNIVLPRLQKLQADPNLINQGGIGLCTAAAFFHHIIQKNPREFYSFGIALYNTGVGFLGNFKISPGSDLRNADYSALEIKTPMMPPQADWMLMSALRDSENWIFDFEGSADETIAMRTSAREMSGWYRKTGFYSSVEYTNDTSLAKIKTIRKTSNNHIAFWIKVGLINNLQTGAHMITIESPIIINETANNITFNYWSYGTEPVKTLITSLDNFKANYYGAIIATF